MSTDLPRARICCRRGCRSTSSCSSCRTGFGHVTRCTPPKVLVREIASSQKPKAQRRCTSQEQDTSYAGSFPHQTMANKRCIPLAASCLLLWTLLLALLLRQLASLVTQPVTPPPQAHCCADGAPSCHRRLLRSPGMPDTAGRTPL